MHAFGRMPNNADAVYVISIGLVSNGVAMFVLLYLMFHVVCVHRSGWHSLGFPGLSNVKGTPPPPRTLYNWAFQKLGIHCFCLRLWKL